MIDYGISAAVASERRRDLLTEAEATRLARQARSHWRRPGMPAARRRPLRRLAGWLLPGWRPERAREEGIRCVTALVAADNAAMAGLLRNANAHIVRYGPDTVEYKTTPVPAGGCSPAEGSVICGGPEAEGAGE